MTAPIASLERQVVDAMRHFSQEVALLGASMVMPAAAQGQQLTQVCAAARAVAAIYRTHGSGEGMAITARAWDWIADYWQPR